MRSFPHLRLLVLLFAVATLATPSPAQLRTGHAIPGFYGLEVAKVPVLGLSYQNATTFYTSSTQTDRNGNSAPGGSISVFTNHNTLTYVSPWLLFGGNLVMRASLPLTNAEPNPHTTDITSDGLGLGDVYLQPLSMYWEGHHHLVTFGYAYWLDNGSFSASARNNRGKGFDTHEASLGLTYYPSKERDWHMSILGRYEMHGSMSGADLKPGQDIILDWNVGKHLNPRWNVGLTGYGVWQTSREGGSDGNGDVGFYGTAALGAEARYAMPDWRGDITLRALHEFNSFNRPEGEFVFLGFNLGF